MNKEFLYTLLDSMSVSGSEIELQKKVIAEMTPHCDKILTEEEVTALKFNYVHYDEAAKRYDPEKLQPGFNTLPDGEEIYYVPNPALGLWIAKDRI